MAKFNQQFEDMLTNSADGRRETINNTTLRELFANRSPAETKSMSQTKINSATRFFDQAGMLDMTPAELTADSVNFTRMMTGEAYESLGQNQATKAQAFLSGILEDAGHGQSWPSRTLKVELGKDVALDKFDFVPTRAKVKEFPDDIFEKLKKSLVRLNNLNDTEAQAQLMMHMFGGYRPEDLADIQISDINFKTGLVENIEIKGAGETVLKSGYFAPPILDAIKLHVGDRKTGVLFENPQANAARINKVFDGVFGSDYLTVTSPKKGARTEPLRVKKLRNLNESILSGFGVDPIARKVLTFRSPASVAEDYAASAARIRQLEKIVGRNVALFSAGSETTSVAQYMNDVGVTAPSKRTSAISATQEVLDDLGYEEAVSQDFYNALPDSGEVVGGKVAGQVDPEVSAALAKKEAQSLLMEAEDIEIARGQKAEELQAARDKQKQTKQEAAAAAKEQTLSDTKEKAMRNIAKVGRRIGRIIPGVGVGLSAIAAEQTYSAVTQQLQAMNLPTGLAKTAGVVAGATEFLPVTPSDVVSAGQFIASQDSQVSPESLETAAMAPRLVGREDFAGPSGPGFASVPQDSFQPIDIPAVPPPSGGMLEAAGSQERVNQARGAAMQGEETTLTGSFLN